MRLIRFLSEAAFFVAALATPALAQKKALTQADWDRWRSIQGAALSDDGKWVAYTLSPQVGDGEFVVRSTTGDTEYRVPVGYIGRPNNTPGGLRPRGGGPGGGRGGRAGGGGNGPFTADSRFAFVTVQPTKDSVEKLEREAAAARGRAAGRGGAGGAAGRAGGTAGRAGGTNQNSIVMVNLASGQVTPMPNARTFRLPAENGRWMVYTATADSANADSAGGGGAAGRGGRAGGGGNSAQATRRTYGNPIMLRNLDTGADEVIPDVSAYQFDDSAKVLAYTVASRSDSTNDGVYIRNLATGTTQAVLTGPGNYRSFTFDRSQTQFVFTSDRDEFGKDSARSVIYHGTVKGGKAEAIIRPDMLPEGRRFPASVSLSLTRAGNAVQFNMGPPPEPVIPADSLVGKANYDLWHWKDPDLQPTQLLRVNQERNRTYQALYHLATKKLTVLTSDSFPSIQLSDDAKLGMASTSEPYNIESMWGEGGNDIYVVDPSTGTRKQVATKISGNAQISTGGKFIIWFDTAAWYTYNVATGKTTNITASAPSVHFEQETHSTPSVPNAWGIAGWTKDDRSVLVNDRFDIWELDPNGAKPPLVLTDSLGRRENMTLRLINLGRDEDERFIDVSEAAWLSAFDEDTKASGFYRAKLDARRRPEQVTMGDLRYGNPSKADDADVYLVTKSTFVNFPNLHVGPNLTTLTQVSDANPWQRDYNWGTAELVTWMSMDGVPRQGILFKPEDFDPSKKYPMISYFYEDRSDGLHAYVAPTGRNIINSTHYVSNGYLVFEPDIHYEMGFPGPSAVKSIVPGVQKLLERGYVDPKALGLQGQSWGGYQASYIVTQTSMFAAAMVGAPVANMTSAYGGIRWGSGLNRSMQYEHGQSRIGESLFEAPQLYIENSPLFHLKRVTTPLFIMHNDMDDAVPWWQGIELFVGMRRLGKEAYLINYNNDVHNPQSRANQKDMAMKMQEFFDNKLMGAPAPEWMVKGIPALHKGKDQLKKVIIP
jgi:dipeptidyl aminopeptidase/acylaminoacyl peptidase